MLTGIEFPRRTWMRSAFFASSATSALRVAAAADALTLHKKNVGAITYNALADVLTIVLTPESTGLQCARVDASTQVTFFI